MNRFYAFLYSFSPIILFPRLVLALVLVISFFILYLFVPFDFAPTVSQTGKVVTCFIYAFVACLSVFVFFCLLPRLMPNLINNSRWTNLRAYHLIGVTLFFISLLHLATTIILSDIDYLGFNTPKVDWDLKSIFKSMAITHFIGIIPILIIVSSQRFFYALSKIDHLPNLDSETQIENRIEPKTAQGEPIITLTGQCKESVELNLEHLLYIESMGNYVNIFYQIEDQITHKALRVSIREIDLQLSQIPSVLQCHRRFMVNTSKITSLKGNKRGYLLFFKNSIDPIPMSTAFYSSINSKIDNN